eukprot:TRINITY_DN391_c0_g2_i17.p1 TRINITY_DN391_c0_g2~~TRINITY_DN391_c0_g2_i17.p1  ORF type:complete len:117 (-),score=18.04 TRINITY_DN391_c0_g2_i17:912-1262(-)
MAHNQRYNQIGPMNIHQHIQHKTSPMVYSQMVSPFNQSAPQFIYHQGHTQMGPAGSFLKAVIFLPIFSSPLQCIFLTTHSSPSQSRNLHPGALIYNTASCLVKHAVPSIFGDKEKK